jgi:hypothetical protein
MAELHINESCAELLRWISERVCHEGLTVREIGDVSGIYNDTYAGMNDHFAQAVRDVKALRRMGRLEGRGRPARWWLV